MDDNIPMLTDVYTADELSASQTTNVIRLSDSYSRPNQLPSHHIPTGSFVSDYSLQLPYTANFQTFSAASCSDSSQEYLYPTSVPYGHIVPIHFKQWNDSSLGLPRGRHSYENSFHKVPREERSQNDFKRHNKYFTNYRGQEAKYFHNNENFQQYRTDYVQYPHQTRTDYFHPPNYTASWNDFRRKGQPLFVDNNGTSQPPRNMYPVRNQHRIKEVVQPSPKELTSKNKQFSLKKQLYIKGQTLDMENEHIDEHHDYCESQTAREEIPVSSIKIGASFDVKKKTVSKGAMEASRGAFNKSKENKTKPFKMDLQSNNRSKRNSHNRNNDSIFENDESQRSTLTEQLSTGVYECMICCEHIKAEAPVWCCSICYHVFHLHCIKKWARSSISKETQNWRCPGCQNISTQIPNQYRCFCGRRKDPEYIKGEIAHSCGEVCKKTKQGDCKHPCTMLCHPGPCPPCSATIWITCYCGNLKKNVRCSKSTKFQCNKECGKKLNCGIHNCRVICHSGVCEPCQVEQIQECLCKKTKRTVFCGSEEFKNSNFSCRQICERNLDCGNHVCKKLCHSGDCESCQLLPKNLNTCCCGKTCYSGVERKSCLDPVPTCALLCNKLLPCGSTCEPHLCEKKCHPDECGPCLRVVQIRCECGGTEKQMTCGEAFTFNETNPFKCQRRCGKKKSCGKHKCFDNCCVKEFHICEIVCGQKLSCGNHRCEELCHRGHCKRCLQASFDELTCHCGREVLEPPVPCGTKPPECQKACTRQHTCQHPVRHNCHSEALCPPCTELTDKMCAGGHIMRRNVPCHLATISCGYPCLKMLPCGEHKCQRPCHNGSCLQDSTKCIQPCQKARPSCGHPCNAPCHDDVCPDEPCKTEVTITCPCGSKTATSQCMASSDPLANIAQFQRLSVQSFSEFGDQGLDLSRFLQAKKSIKRLDCDSNCAMLERNRRLALALEIKNPDLHAKLGNPAFTEFLKDYAKKNLKFASNVETSLNSLVQSAKQSVQSSRSFAFQSMNRDQRRFVHELAEFYGCQTQSYDSEPNKNVVATAQKDKCWLPNVTLTQLVSKGQTMKVPPLGPPVSQGTNFTILEKKKLDGLPKRAWENLTTSMSQHKVGVAEPIDYFDYTE